MSQKKSLIVILFIISTLLISVACSSKPEANPPAQKKQPAPAQQPKEGTVNPKPTQEKVKFAVFFGDDQAMNLVPEQREVEKGTASLPELMVQELISGPKETDHTPTVPKEAKLLSLDIVDDVAFVNFSKEIQTKHWGGSTGEIMTIYSIVDTLSQLPEIKSVQFLIEGEKQEAIWGNTETDIPVKPDDSLIKK